MLLQDIVDWEAWSGRADVVGPQRVALGKFACQSMYLWAIVHAGRIQATLTSMKGAAQSTSRSEKWSRGCRAPRSPFWHFVWLPLWQLAPRKPKKSFTLMTAQPLPPSRPIPANTSKTIGRAGRAWMPAPALFMSDPCCNTASAEGHSQQGAGFAWAPGLAYGQDTNLNQNWSARCGQPLFSPCLPLPLLRLAPRHRRQHQSRWQLPPNPPIPANISNPGGQACGRGPAATAPREIWGRKC